MKNHLAQVEKFNFWKTSPAVGFYRTTYMAMLKSFQNTRLVKVLVGQRRTGKSFLLRQCIQELIDSGVPRKNTLYINAEYVEYGFLQNYMDLFHFVEAYRKKFKPEGRYHVFIDEIQLIDQWERVINSLSQDFTQDIEIYITGSNSTMLSGELATLLSGRYVQLEVLPFSYQEHCDSLQLPMNRTTFLEFMQHGGLPELYHLPSEESRRGYISALRDTILLRDVIQRYQVKDTVLLLDLFNYMVNNFGNLTSVSNLVKYWESKKRKTSYETLSNYVNYMCDTFLLHECNRFDLKGKELLGGNVKLYLNDLAFHTYLFGGTRHGLGYMLENSVYLMLLARTFDVYVGVDRNKEIDFLAEKFGRKIYLQVAYSIENETTFQREVDWLLKVKDNYEKWIITLDETSTENYEGIRILKAWELNDELGKWEMRQGW